MNGSIEREFSRPLRQTSTTDVAPGVPSFKKGEPENSPFEKGGREDFECGFASTSKGERNSWLFRQGARPFLLSAAVILVLTGCGDDKQSDSSTKSRDAGVDGGVINPGEMGASCDNDKACFDSLLCIDGECQPHGCQSGLLGCACAEGGTCVSDSTGVPLQCVVGTCVYPDCTFAGQTGCPCLNKTECANPGDVCENSVCFAAACSAGTEGCMCLAGTCNPGLFCKDNTICVDATGYEGGTCLSNGQCYTGSRCDNDLGVCIYCEFGSEGCQCTDANSCSEGLICSAGLCLSGNALPPTVPPCYTPCLSDLTTAVGTITCDADGLLPGCVEGLACVEGSCLSQGETKPSCETELDCPFYQTCLQGGCYSNCEADTDCAPGLGCYKKVCRTPCRTVVGADPCPEGYNCDAPDGENGYCMGMAAPSDTPQSPPSGGFSLSRSMIEFSNIRVSHQFQILSDSAKRQSFTIRKLNHTLHFADGTSERVEAPKDRATGEYTECDAAAGECPLFWLDMSHEAEPTRETTLDVEALSNCGEADCPFVTLGNAGGSPGIRWEGELEITSENGRAVMLLTYVERPEGQWVGTMYYFGNFSDRGFDEWLVRENRSDVTGVSNGLIQRWGAFRSGTLTNGWQEFEAVLTATRTGSWKYGEVVSKCEAVNGAGTSAACYPFSNTAGVRTYVNDKDVLPIPTGLSEFDMGMNLRIPAGNAASLEGRIESSIAMHYAANPTVTLTFSADPSMSSSCDPAVQSDCVVYITALESEITVGGRYLTDAATGCGPGYDLVKTPWLVPGFTLGTTVEPDSGLRYQYNCMDSELPYDAALDTRFAPINASLAGGNPVPDGLPRPRSFRLIDGALVNQSSIFFLFEERFESFVGNTGEMAGDKEISAYGYMILKKQPTDIDATDENVDGIADAFQGAVPPVAPVKTVTEPVGVTCDPKLLNDIGLGTPGDPETDINHLVAVLLSGNALPADPSTLELVSDSNDPNVRVHYYCEDTGLFDGGELDVGIPRHSTDADGGVPDSLSFVPVKIPCPAGSRVEYFVVTESSDINQEMVAGQACQKDVVCETVECDEPPCLESQESYAHSCRGGSCQETLNQWRANGLIESWTPLWRCRDDNKNYCDENRLDLRAEKIFYRLPEDSPGKVLLDIRPAIAEAFRYKTRFVGRTGNQVGFAPEICIPDSDQIPYCYDPEAIEEIRKRVDCLIAIYSNDALYSSLETAAGGAKGMLDEFLRESFSKEAFGDRFGFERLHSELLVMQGDEALTAAFASRFDLAGAGGASFEGELFENNGINLSGVAGFEMYRLYQAIQYYQTALDRLYTSGPNMTKALERNPSTDSPTNFISPETVVHYLDRLIRASTQKSRAVSEVAKNYQSFNRPDLARQVIERAYTSTYLESVILSRLMTDISEKSTSPYRPQIEKTIEDGQRRYKTALLDMKDIHSSITDNINYFGFAPEYIPFPALSTSFNVYDTNAFKSLLDTALSKTAFAKQREEQALASNRSYNTDAASFQSELVRIRNNYEAQLGDLCGLFEGPDGRTYPATQKYSDLDNYAALLGDPCGLMSNGRIHSTMIEMENSVIQQQILSTRLDNVFDEIAIEERRVGEQCGLIDQIADYQYKQAGRTMRLRDTINATRILMDQYNRRISMFTELYVGLNCVPSGPPPDFGAGECVHQATDASIRFAGAAASSVISLGGDLAIAALEHEIADIDRDTAKWVTEHQCDALEIDSNARTAGLLLQTKEIELESLRAAHQTRLLISEIDRLFKESKRLQAEQAETEQLLINVEAARNDPNVRIYRNDAVINADIAFNDAVRAAYRATKVFEYYTSQTYAQKEQLFLIRMVTAGDYNLENYLVQLQNEFYEFEEQFGNPDVRVSVMSLRDDIMRIPTLDENATALTQGMRIEMMRERLASVEMLDSNGYLSIPFSTNLEALSPLTRNHKIVYVEADIVGADVGDTVGRLYLRQAGTGVVRNVNDEIDYVVFPERTAVLDPFFNGNRLFEPEVYKSYRFRDRPMVNTSWEMMFNQRDETVNKDIDLQSLSDIRLYIYYTDFTVF